MLKDLKKKYPCLVLFVTHDVAEALDVADRILVMSTRPATILSDIRLPPQDQRPENWATSLDHSRLEAQILQTIREARDAGSVGSYNLRVGV